MKKQSSLLAASSSGRFSFSACPPIGAWADEEVTAATGIVLVQLGGRGLEISVNKDDRLTGNGSEAIKKSALESIFFLLSFYQFFFFLFS